MRRFHLQRDEDATGISGVGKGAEGVQFSTGEVALRWLTANWSCVFYLSMTAVEAIHGHGGKTKIVWDDPETPKPDGVLQILESIREAQQQQVKQLTAYNAPVDVGTTALAILNLLGDAIDDLRERP